MHSVAMAAALASRNGAPDEGFAYPTLLRLDPSVLSDLMQERGEDRAARSFFYEGLVDGQQLFGEWFKNGLKRMAYFSVSALLWDLATYSFDGDQTKIPKFYEEVEKWASAYIHNQESDNDSDPQA
jgi:hypothetical protein